MMRDVTFRPVTLANAILTAVYDNLLESIACQAQVATLLIHWRV